MEDSWGRKIDYMRISLTELCNLRCNYCMPPEGVPKKRHEDMLRQEEVVAICKVAASLGISKIRLTGGEPLIKRGIVDLCEKIREIEGLNELCITSNGILLSKYAEPLKKAGVDRINISIDSLRPDRYRAVTGGEIRDLLKGIEATKKAGFKKTKFNVVLMRGVNDDEIYDFVKLTEYEDIEIRFIELMPIGYGIAHYKRHYMLAEEVLKKIPELKPATCQGGVAQVYTLPGHMGRVGLIKPISCQFCESCNKIRLTADGRLKPCLHSREEISLKGKSKEEIYKILEETIKSKPKKREALDGEHPSQTSRSMNQIGG